LWCLYFAKKVKPIFLKFFNFISDDYIDFKSSKNINYLKIKKLADKERELSETEIFRLREELNVNLVQLNEKAQQVAKLTERCQDLEQRIKQKDEEVGKTNQELIVI